MDQRIEMLPVSALFESPDNYRKTINAEALQEMAGTMREVGVQQPLKVRPLPMLASAAHHTYEIVFGHRRFRAAKIAELERVPCMVEELTNEEADKLRLIENIQREDVTPVEEADALVRLSEQHKVNADTLGKIIGISRTGVYDRMKLASAHPSVRDKCQAGVFGGQIATAIARLPVSIQPVAMKKIMTQQPDPEKGPQGTKMVALSVREAKQKLQGEFTVKLDTGGFDLENPQLHECGSCTGCDKRSDNVEALLADFGPGVCIDTECFEIKQVANVDWRIDQAKRFGAPVIEGEAARKVMPHQWASWFTGYQRLGDVHALVRTKEGHKRFSYEDLVALSGQPEPTPTLLRDPHNPSRLHVLLTDEQAEALEACAPEGEPAPTPAQPKQSKPARELTPEEVAVSNHDSWMRIKRTIMAAAALEQRTTAEMRMVVHALSEHLDEVPGLVAELMGWPEDTLPQSYGGADDFVATKAKTMGADELGKLAVLLALDQAPFYVHDNYQVKSEQDEAGEDDETDDDEADNEPPVHVRKKLELAAAYGINVLLAAEPEPEPVAPTPVAAAAKEGPTLALDLGEPGQQEDKATPTLKPAATFLHSKATAKYRNSATGETWTGRGLQPKWIQAALAGGHKLEDFVVGASKFDDRNAPIDAGLAEFDREREVNA